MSFASCKTPVLNGRSNVGVRTAMRSQARKSLQVVRVAPGDSVDDLGSLNDPAHINCAGTTTIRVKELPGSFNLDAYMRLPVQQYSMLDPSLIDFAGANRFTLSVPRFTLFNIWVSPVIEVVVSLAQNPPRVILEASKCRIRGSEGIENLKLDRRFAVKMVTELSWRSAASGSTEGTITGSSRLDVWCEVVQPFQLMPRPVLEGTCNSILQLSLDALLPLFLRRLGDDFEKWNRDPAYRAQRQSQDKPLAPGAAVLARGDS